MPLATEVSVTGAIDTATPNQLIAALCSTEGLTPKPADLQSDSRARDMRSTVTLALQDSLPATSGLHLYTALAHHDDRHAWAVFAIQVHSAIPADQPPATPVATVLGFA